VEWEIGASLISKKSRNDPQIADEVIHQKGRMRYIILKVSDWGDQEYR
jgi:hypothetical protein